MRDHRLPTRWRSTVLEQHAEIRTGIAKGKNDLRNPVAFPYLRVANVQDGHLDLSKIKTIEIEPTQLERYLLKNGDVLLTEGGDFDKLGRGTVWRGEIEPCLHQNHIFAVRVNCEELIAEFFSYQAASAYGKRYFLACSKQSTNLASINSTQLRQFPLLLPPLSEQRRIAEILQSWDEAIEMTERLIAAKERRFRPLRERLAWDSKGESPFVSLEQIIAQSSQRVGGGRDLRVYSVTKDGLILQSEHFKKRIANDDISRHMLVMHGDFVLSGLNFWLGSVDVSLEPEPFCISPDYKVFKLNNDLEPRFFRQLIRTAHFRYILKSVAVERASVVRKNFDRETFLQSEVPLPRLERQTQISQALEAAEREVALEAERRKNLIRQKRGLMQKLLTGEWRVPLRDSEVDDLAERVATGEAA